VNYQLKPQVHACFTVCPFDEMQRCSWVGVPNWVAPHFSVNFEVNTLVPAAEGGGISLVKAEIT